MADVNTTVNETRKAGVRQMKKHNLKTDMTPMVDLGFLLIAFFVVTAELSKPTATDLFVPKDEINSPVGESDAVTLLIGKDNTLFYYEGEWLQAKENEAIAKTNYSYADGIGAFIRDKQKRLDNNPLSREGRAGLMLIIKPGADASYENMVDLLDEVMINVVKKYVIAKMESSESEWLLKNQ